MTIPVAPRKSGPYTGNGVNKSFAYTFKALASDEFKVILTTVATSVDVTLNPSTYTVSGVGSDAGGTITYPASGSAITSAYTITIIGDTDISQEVDISNSGDFYPNVHELVFDKLTAICQQQQEEIERCVKLSASSTVDPDDLIEDLETASASATAAASAASAAQTAAELARDEAQLVAAVGNFPICSFTGDGSETHFTLLNGSTPIVPGTVGRILWIEGGVVQVPGVDFTVASNVVTRTTAPTIGVAITAIIWGADTQVNVPTDGSVTEVKLATGAVTNTKLGSGAVTLDKLAASLLSSIYPVGSIYTNATDSTNPSTLLGFGTWAAFGEGRVPVGAGSGTDAKGFVVSFAAGDTGGEYKHSLTESENGQHNHQGWEQLTHTGGDSTGASSSAPNTAKKGTTSTNTDYVTASSGLGNPHNNIQPYVTVYMWKRTA